MQIITVITQTMDMARRNFSRGEQMMLIDIFNGTILTPGILGQHIIAQVEDSFALYSGMYEEKWGVDRKEMEEKIRALDILTATWLELWAVGFWALNDADRSGMLESYVAGKINLAEHLTDILARLHTVSETLLKSRSVFKSATIADARHVVEETATMIQNLI
jgi:hypothetical protein